MSTWTDERIESALAGLAGQIDLHEPAAAARARRRTRRHRSRWLGAAAASLAVAIGAVLTVPAGRATVTDWFGLGSVRFHRTTDSEVGAGRLIDGLTPLGIEAALAELGPIGERLDAVGLGRPDAAGRPTEGGVVVSWSEDAVTLWALDVRDGVQLDKSLGAGVPVRPLPQLGGDAVLVDGRHDLGTPIRTVTAERVIWWIDGDSQYRLEADLAADELIAIAENLAGP